MSMRPATRSWLEGGCWACAYVVVCADVQEEGQANCSVQRCCSQCSRVAGQVDVALATACCLARRQPAFVVVILCRHLALQPAC